MTHIHTLTGLRGIAALIVFLSHAANESLMPAEFGRGYGQIGVMLFFVLSGFLMAHLYVRSSFEPANLRKYVLARAGRVLPLYLATVLISIFIANVVVESYVFDFTDTTDSLMTLFLIKGKSIFWTIPVEIHFYCIFVLFWWLYQKKVGAPYLVAVVALTMLPSLWIYATTNEVLRSVISTYSFAFFIGVGTALGFRHIRHDGVLKKLADYAGLPLLVLLFLNLPQLRHELGLAFGDDRFFRTWGDPVNWLVIYGLFLCALYNARSLAILNLRPLVFLGEVSYGLYLIHLPIVIYCAEYIPSKALALLSALFLTRVVSYLSFRYFERPVANKIRHL